jgi:hypothetical protein
VGYGSWAWPAEWQRVLNSPEPGEFLRSSTTLLCPWEELAGYSALDFHGDHAGAAKIPKFPEELVTALHSKHPLLEPFNIC